jgi:putative oxidoreductase
MIGLSKARTAHVEVAAPGADGAASDRRPRPALNPGRRLLRRLGAILMSGIFVKAGWDAVREPGGRPDKAAALGLPQPDLMVRANGLGMAVGGVAIALGIKPRLAALALIGLLVPTTLAGHRFWEEATDQGRSAQQIQFLKNLGLIGGLLVFASMPRR